MNSTQRLCLHTITTKPWPIETAARKYSLAGIGGISVWRDALEGRDPKEVRRLLEGEGLEVVSLVRGGFFASDETSKRQAAIEDNLHAIEEAAAIGAPLLVLVCGSDPGQSLEESRKQIAGGIASILPRAAGLGVKLAIEPLHPMYADSRSAINTLEQATSLAIDLGSEHLGVAVDVYHLWWDPELETRIRQCGEAGKIFAFHICDWKVPTEDFLTDREIMGRGCIRVPVIRQWVEQAGFNGFIEVEIFSEKYWAMDQDACLADIMEAYKYKS